MNAPPFPLNPGVGDWFQNWVWNGARWMASPTTGLRVMTRVFKESGPYMPSPGLVSLMVECVGGGGGGGGAIGTGDGTTMGWMVSGGGGGSGGYSRSTLPAALVRGGVLVTVGEAGAFGTWNASDNGKDGGATSFGALVVANGGHGGWSATPAGGWNGLGAEAGIGDLAEAGTPGGMHGGTVNDPGIAGGSVVGGNGGSGFFGGGGGGAYAVAGAQEWPRLATEGAPNSGAGGGGGAAANSLWMNQGAYGGSGVCIVTEYCWGDRDQPDIGWRPPLDVNVSFPKPPWPGGQPGPVPPWPPGSPWWPWWPWPPGQPSRPPLPGPREFEAEQQSFQPWDDPNASDS